MTKEQIIQIARLAGVRDDEHIFEFSEYKYLERFVKLVIEHEECVKLCDKYFERVKARRIRTKGQE